MGSMNTMTVVACAAVLAKAIAEAAMAKRSMRTRLPPRHPDVSAGRLNGG
jgi:hypothetical protein